MAVMLLAMVIIVVSPLVQSSDGGDDAPSAAVPREQAPFFPVSPGSRIAPPVPAWVYAAGALVSAFGAALFFAGTGAAGVPRGLSLFLMPGGLLFVLAVVLVYDGPADRRNVRLGAAAVVSLLIMIAGFMIPGGS